jgi:hypothetical protein
MLVLFPLIIIKPVIATIPITAAAIAIRYHLRPAIATTLASFFPTFVSNVSKYPAGTEYGFLFFKLWSNGDRLSISSLLVW